MRSAREIRRAAGVALQSSAGWLPSVCAWAAWFALEKVALTPLMLLGPLCLVGVYYFAFAKTYGMSLLSMSVLRGEPRFRYAFAGFGHGWRTFGVHCWIAWRLFLPALALLALFLAVCCCAPVVGAPADAAAFLRTPTGIAGACGVGVCASACSVWLLRRWYRYRLAYYVFVEHVDWKLSAVVDEAARLMDGHRGELFRLDLRYAFLGLVLLLPGVYQTIDGGLAFYRAGGDLLELQAVLMTGAKELPPGIGTALQGMQVLGFAQLIVLLWVQPVWTTVHAAFYEDLLDLDEARHPQPASVSANEGETEEIQAS